MSQQDRNPSAGLVAAYREGLGLATIAVICAAAEVRIAAAEHADESRLAAGEIIQQRWWCRSAAEAEQVAAAASARLRRQPPQDGGSAALACESIVRAAKRLNIVLRTDQQIFDEAMVVVERINCEIEQLRNAGGLRPVNKSYQAYRLEAATRGERVVPYARWMHTYKENLVRKAAATLRFL